MDIKLLSARNTTNGVPTVGTGPPTVGIQIRGLNANSSSSPPFAGLRESDEAVLVVNGPGGVTAPTVTLRLWGYQKVPVGDWAKIKDINAGAAIPLIGADTVIRYSEVIQFFKHFDALYLEIVAIAGGTPPNVSAWMICRGSGTA